MKRGEASATGGSENIVPLHMTPAYLASVLGNVKANERLQSLTLPPKEKDRKIVRIEGLDDQ